MLNIYDFITGNNAFKKFAIDGLLFVQYKCILNETRVGYWTHNNYFVYVLEGNKRWFSQNSENILRQGDAIFLRKGAYMAEQVDNKNEFSALLIFLTDEFIKSILDKYPTLLPRINKISPEQYDPILPLRMDETLSAYFNSVLSYFPQATTPSPQLLRIKFEELLLSILTSGRQERLAAYFRQEHQNDKVSIRNVMETSFMYNMSMEEYARLCARSLSTFKADFYEIYKTTPGKWLMNTRLHYGKCLIETTDEPVNDIADRSGFINTAHFITVFKSAYGMPPLQYRLNRIRSYSIQTMEIA